MPNNHETVVLKSENDKPVRQRHPWVFSGAIRHIPDSLAAGMS